MQWHHPSLYRISARTCPVGPLHQVIVSANIYVIIANIYNVYLLILYFEGMIFDLYSCMQ